MNSTIPSSGWQLFHEHNCRDSYTTNVHLWNNTFLYFNINEKADKLAKCAASSDLTCSYSKAPSSYVKCYLTNNIQDTWNSQFKSSEKGKLTRKLLGPIPQCD